MTAWVVGVTRGELAGGTLEGCGEEQGLAALRDHRDDPVDGRLEAHVEHPVGLVEDERLDVLESQRTALDQVLEAPGCGDEDVRLRRLADLRLHADAAVDDFDLERPRPGDRLELIDDLAGQLAGRGEDERRRASRIGGDPVDERQAESERLAGARRRLDEDVAARQHVLDHEALDGERGFDAAIGECVDYGLGHAEIGEGLGHSVLLL